MLKLLFELTEEKASYIVFVFAKCFVISSGNLLSFNQLSLGRFSIDGTFEIYF